MNHLPIILASVIKCIKQVCLMDNRDTAILGVAVQERCPLMLNVLFSPGINMVADLSTEYDSYVLVDGKENLERGS